MKFRLLPCTLSIVVLAALATTFEAVSGAHAAAPRPQTVFMKNHGSDTYLYTPGTLRIRVGTRVIWRNTSAAPHSITPLGKVRAFNEQVAKDIEPRHSWAFTFRHPGTFTYYCIFHPYMKAKVIVRP